MALCEAGGQAIGSASEFAPSAAHWIRMHPLDLAVSLASKNSCKKNLTKFWIFVSREVACRMLAWI
jgi:hypothetical protein